MTLHFSPALLFQDICSLKDVALSEDVVILNPEFDNAVKQFPVPNLSTELIEKITSKLYEKKGLAEVLNDENFVFPYYQEIIDSIPLCPTEPLEIVDFISIRLLYMLLPWLLQITVDTDENFINHFLKSFIYTTKSSYKEIVEESYQTIFEVICLIPSFYKFNTCIRELHQYLLVNPSIDFLCFILGKITSVRLKLTDPFFAQALESIALLSHEFPTVFAEGTTELLLLLTSYLTSLESPALSFLGKMIVFVQDDSLNAVISLMADNFIEKIDSINPIRIDRKPEKIDLTMDSQNPVFSFENTKEMKLDFNSLPTLPQPKSFVKICGSECSELISYLANAFKENMKSAQYFINYSCNIIAKNAEKETFLSEWFSIIEFVSKLNLTSHFSISKILIHPKLFYEDLTVFNYKNGENDEDSSFSGPPSPIRNQETNIENELTEEDASKNILLTDVKQSTESKSQEQASSSSYFLMPITNKKEEFIIINSLREKAIDILLDEKDNGAIEGTLIQTSQMPFVFSELCLRLIARASKMIQKVTQIQSLLTTIVDISTLYQVTFFKQDYEGFSLARRCSLYLLSYLLQNNDIRLLFFKNERIVNSFLSYMFELNDVLAFVIQNVHDYLLNQENDNLVILIDKLVEILNHALNQDEKYFGKTVILFTTVLDMLNDICSFNNDIKQLLTDICPLLWPIYYHIQNTDECRKYILSSLTFSAHMTIYYLINEDQSNYIINSVKKIQTHEFLNNLLFPLNELLAGEYLCSKTCSFIIKTQHLTKIYLLIYFDTDFLPQIIDDFIQICNYSAKNIDILSSCGFDIVLLECLYKYQTTDRIDSKIVDKILNLYSMLSVANSSHESVLRYIKLFSPIEEDNLVSPYQNQYLHTFSCMIEDSINHQIKYIPLKGIENMSEELNDERIVNGFTFTCWIYLEKQKADYRPILFQILFEDDVTVGVIVTNNAVVPQVMTPTTQTQSKVNYVLPIHRWVFVSFSFKSFFSRLSVLATVDCLECDPVLLPNTQFSSRFQVRLGDDFSTDVVSPNKLTAPLLSVYTNPKDCATFRNLGMKFEESSITSECIYSFKDLKGTCDLIPKFMHCLIDKSVIPALFPLLLHRNWELISDHTTVRSFEICIRMLNSILKFSQLAQMQFLEANGFEIISSLLISQWGREFTLKIYQQFEQMMYTDNLLIQNSVFRNILVNFELISLLEQKTQIKLIKQYLQNLYTTFQEQFALYFNYTHILHILRIYYYYEIKEDVVQKRNNDNLDVKPIRQNLIALMMNFAQENFDETFFTEIIGNILSIPDYQQNIDLFDFILEVVSAGFCKFSFEDTSIQGKLFSIFTLKNSTYDSYVIKILASLKSKYQLSPDFYEKTTRLLINCFLPDTDPKTIIETCITEVKEIPEFFPLCCFLSKKTGHLFAIEIMNLIRPEIIDKLTKTSLMWPLTLCVKLQNNDLTRKFIQCLCKCKDKLIDIFNLFDIVCGSYTDQSYSMKSMFIKTLGDILINKQLTASKHIIDIFFNIVKSYLFYRPVSQPNKYLQTLFSSTYGETFRKEKIEEHPDLRATLRFDENGEWMDCDVARVCLDVYLEFNSTQYLPLVLILCSYMQRLPKSKSAIMDLAKMSLTEKERTQNQESINFFAYHTEIAKKNQFFLHSKIPQNPNFLNEFYEKNLMEENNPLQDNNIKSLIQSESIETLTMIEQIYSIDSTTLQNQVLEKAKQEQKQIQRIKIINYNKWEKIWSALSQKEGIWNVSSKSPQNNSNKYRHTVTQSFAFIPTKIGEFRFTMFNPDFSHESTSKPTIISYPCNVVTLEDVIPASFDINEDEIIIQTSSFSSLIIPLNELKCLFIAKGKKQNSGLQIIRQNGESFTLDFTGINATDIINKIYSLHPKKIEHVELNSTRELLDMELLDQTWIKGNISTFEYISILNRCDGRSFENLNNYPIFPVLYDVEQYIKNELESNTENNNRNIIVQRDFSKAFRFCDKAKVLSLLSSIQPYNKIKEKLEGEKSKEINESNENGEIYEWIPEYFCCPTFFEPLFNGDKRKAQEFVYRNRKLLESEEVSNSIHLWINQVWKFSPEQLPRKIVERKRRALHFVVPFNDIISIYYSKSHFTVLHNKNEFLCFQINFFTIPQNPTVGTDPTSNIFILKSELDSPITYPKAIVPIDFERVAVIRNQKPYLDIITNNDKTVHFFDDCRNGYEYKINCVHSDGDWIVVGTENSEIIAFNEQKQKFVIETFKDSITNIFVKEALGLIAAVTRTGSIIVCSLVNGTVLTTVQLEHTLKPQKLLISNCFGFIIVYSTEATPIGKRHFISVYSSNLDFVSFTELNSSIDSWHTFSTNKAIDYLVVSSLYSIKCCEVFYVDKITQIAENLESETIYLNYSDEINSVIAVQKDGGIYTIPFYEF